MAGKMNYDLSDGLRELAQLLRPFDHGGVQLEGKAVRNLTNRIGRLLELARHLENEVSRHRWNEIARAERASDEALLAALEAPGSNVLLFTADRPFTDGWPGGRRA